MTEREEGAPQAEHATGEYDVTPFVERIQSGDALTQWAALPPLGRTRAHFAVIQLAITMQSVLRGESIESLRAQLDQLPQEEYRAHLFAAIEHEEVLRDPLTGELTAPPPRVSLEPNAPSVLTDPALLAEYRQTTDRLCAAVERLQHVHAPSGEDEQ